MFDCITDCRDSVTSFMKGFLIILPKFPDALVHRVFFVMQVYLTNGWRISFTHAAAIMNFWEGMSLILPPLFQFLADTVLGNFTVAITSTIFSTAGIGMVALSVPSILNRNGGWCKLAKAESCLNETQEALFFTGMVLTALGRAGISFSLDALRDEQIQRNPHRHRTSEDSCLKKACQCYRDCGVQMDLSLFYLYGSLIVFLCIKKWKLLFGIPAIYSAYVNFWFLFLCVCCWYKKTQPLNNTSPLITGCKVLYAAATSKNKSPPLIQNDHHHPQPLLDRFPIIYSTTLTRCLDRALPSEGERPDNTRTFDKEKVETTRFVVAMIPISMTFIFCGVVSSIGNTYFVEQANHMKRRVGKWNVPLLALQLPVIWFKLWNDLYLWLFFKIDKDTLRKYLKMDLPIAGIAMAMTYSVLCCITAARMEMKRLKVIRTHHLVDKPDNYEIPMHAAWLLFQFFLLAGLDSWLRKSIEEFYKDHAPKELKTKLDEDKAESRYLMAAVDFVSGLGYLTSVLSVYVVGNLTHWFQNTLNKSRLDRYYWLLAGLSAVNFLVFYFVSMAYMRKPQPN